jgi:hypothetical protein
MNSDIFAIPNFKDDLAVSFAYPCGKGGGGRNILVQMISTCCRWRSDVAKVSALSDSCSC